MKEYSEITKAFYNTIEWKKCREGYKRYKCYLCEECGRTSNKMIVHHKVHLNGDNVYDPNYTMDWSNLELLCIECHNKRHFKENAKRRYKVLENGEIVPLAR